ncbi:hypothetical protein BBW65_00560 [Helicobacter enhydrae]|uniref:Pimelyl-ACP methyl ester esterase BioV n=1 Tax=Helicobacter enhydrae TaxID=222136 RepID=A0A1B1U3R3_9HELI|nr:pimelyl-ACP methyl ester esterase BioV [Helicobacter enhydrae]ANV97400.1 hypothetical protein BBW65_00560 [Helicobacter enhydrae]
MKKFPNFFSGFCFQNEGVLFEHLANLQMPYSFSGFSYGSILAFRATLQSLKNHQRVQKLNLFSPAFFQNQSPAFLRMQILGYKQNPQNYIKKFLDLCHFNHQNFLKIGTLEELQDLLYFQWNPKDLEWLVAQGVEIEVFLGAKDQVICAESVRRFFTPFAQIRIYANHSHCLQDIRA